MAQSNMNNLTTLIKRLEAATSRLEDIASSTGVALDSNGATPGAAAAPPGSRQVAGAATSVPASTGQVPSPSPGGELPSTVRDFDQLLQGDLQSWVSSSESIGPVIAEQAAAVKQAFEAQRTFLLVATKAKKPDQTSSKYMDLLRDLQQAMEKVDDVRQANRSSNLKDHLAMVADGVGALGWITIDNKPADYVAELFGGAQMYGNKVLKQYKDNDRAHVEWVQGYYKIFKSLIAYIKQHHMMGVQWARDGVDAGQALQEVKSGASAPSTNGALPPPPPPPAGGLPPPPPPPLPSAAQLAAQQPRQPQKSGGDMNAVFDELSRGEAVTSGLRKVDPSMQTHKNPSLRAQGAIERSDSSSSIGRSKSPSVKPKPESFRTKKPPRKELDGNKWIIENFDNPESTIEVEVEINQSLLITKCKNTTLRISGKANAISLDNSPRMSIIMDSLVSSVDVIKCPNFALQVLGTLPTILLDQVDGGTLYLSPESLETEIFTSKCSNININLPPAKGDETGDYKEEAVPEQFRSYIQNGRLVSEIVEHAG